SLFRFGNSHNLLTTSIGIIFLASTVISSDMPVSFVNVLLYAISLLLSVWMIHSVATLFMSLNFIFGPTQGTAGVIYQFQELEKYPASSYENQGLFIKVFIFPIALLTSIPASLLISKSLPPHYILTYFLSLIVITIVSEKVWHSSIRYYSSASS
ncbi:MAG: ABC-2 family transporter protein, partial [Patescibacteria group bacterium]